VTLGHTAPQPDTYPGDVLDIPRSARLAAWGTAWLQGQASTRAVVRAVEGDDEPHVVEPQDVLGGAADDLEGLLSALREAGASGLRLVLPAPGDPVGLPGPPAFNVAALEAGECVLTSGGPSWGAVPEVTEFGSAWEPGHLVTWQVRQINEPSRRGGPVEGGSGLADAERELKEGLLAATATLNRLDVAALGPDAAEQLQQLRRAELPPGTLPSGTPARTLQVLSTAGRLRAVLTLASQDDGAAVTVFEAQERARALRELDVVCRHALVAAVNAATQPDVHH
jgi:hypothetical protein